MPYYMATDSDWDWTSKEAPPHIVEAKDIKEACEQFTALAIAEGADGGCMKVSMVSTIGMYCFGYNGRPDDSMDCVTIDEFQHFKQEV